MLYLAGGPLEGREPHGAVRQELAALYQRAWGAEMPPLVRAAGGKPRFAAGGLHCSMTHTRQAAFCALSDRPVGLDAEPLDREISPALAPRILLPEELARYEEARNPGRTFLAFWVLKEAYVKYTGRGLSGLMEAGPFDLPTRRLRTPAGEGLRFWLLEREGHLLALCSSLEERPQFLEK